ncbi:hypothetical protein H112_03931 [Trichophyton rubrum D6]|uniref:Uncharacterized protein n=3 Tax=Trichophyton TaxID=5550 RepID=A0A080WM34_TRIRC|nr:uncharacterized protein TERG_12258 [Trichophyton rubrum CBS 118892]EZF23489.1 hypothetical protein H100_03939 [Trichophyton rubrum MR850]EZF42446.1 hypothetical protein H102_03926 [Trichophyton rubrum CBS 100081]EZF53264.1 hypothetical protein H103_03941 [Trichophyton rubrum CBS 288.86]EZF63648.1 hypothetical protein H104_03926 [Trichophyton rubrum CBS 289.86]EZF74252.1 hypothetical protein H105_03954 [Trichophyton soudanense CBS 452.61]EZF85001.1 hypothetical protein H110_03933 [Trichophy
MGEYIRLPRKKSCPPFDLGTRILIDPSTYSTTSVTWDTITVPIKLNARPRRLLQAERRIQGFAAEGRFAGEDEALLLREPCHGRVAARQGRSASRSPSGIHIPSPIVS